MRPAALFHTLCDVLLRQLDGGSDHAEEEEVDEHIPGVEPEVLHHADYRDAAKSPHGGGQDILGLPVGAGVEAFDARLNLMEHHGEEGNGPENA